MITGKRIICWILAVAMLFSIMPVAAFAVDEYPTTAEPTISAERKELSDETEPTADAEPA